MQMDDVKDDKNLKEKATDLVDHIEDLATTFYKLSVVNITQKTSTITSGIIVTVITGVIGLFVLLFLGVALSLWLGDLIDNRTGGFLLGAGVFLIILFILVMMRKQIMSPIRNFIISKIYDKAD